MASLLFNLSRVCCWRVFFSRARIATATHTEQKECMNCIKSHRDQQQHLRQHQHTNHDQKRHRNQCRNPSASITPCEHILQQYKVFIKWRKKKNPFRLPHFRPKFRRICCEFVSNWIEQLFALSTISIELAILHICVCICFVLHRCYKTRNAV